MKYRLGLYDPKVKYRLCTGTDCGILGATNGDTMDYILAGLILYGITQVHALHYRNHLQEKLVKDFWVALEALKLHVVNSENGVSANTGAIDTFLAAIERCDERLSRLEPKVSDSE